MKQKPRQGIQFDNDQWWNENGTVDMKYAYEYDEEWFEWSITDHRLFHTDW